MTDWFAKSHYQKKLQKLRNLKALIPLTNIWPELMM